MAIQASEQLELTIERPAWGGRMIARHDGEIVLVSGAIPGERVLARVNRAERRLAFADTVRVLEPSPDRREALDPACGGCLYAHIAYERQLRVKADVVLDAFTRIGRMPWDQPLEVAASPERGYRLRARFHVGSGRPGFYREGSHTLCDPRATGQMLETSIDSVEAAVAALTAQGVQVGSVELAENIAADNRALHFDVAAAGTRVDALERAAAAGALTGCTARTRDGTFVSAGDPIVSDPLAVLTSHEAAAGFLRRHPEAFFQANRYLLATLAASVVDAVLPGPVIDLYAGVGLFACALAAAGREDVVAVEGDPVSGRDLLRNAAQFHDRLRVSRSSVEAFMAQGAGSPGTLIVDPPRTGMSKGATDAIVRAGATRIVYVSCDAPTMARDTRRLLDAGYRLTSLRGFDLFPNTPHVETVGVFERS